jgi:hypothetical protein
MRDCRDVIMMAKPGYIYVVRNGGKMGAGRQEAGRKWREERGGKTGKKWREGMELKCDGTGSEDHACRIVAGVKDDTPSGWPAHRPPPPSGGSERLGRDNRRRRWRWWFPYTR